MEGRNHVCSDISASLFRRKQISVLNLIHSEKNSLSHDLVSTMSVLRKKLNLRHQHSSRTKKNTIVSPTKIQTFFNYNFAAGRFLSNEPLRTCWSAHVTSDPHKTKIRQVGFQIFPRVCLSFVLVVWAFAVRERTLVEVR